MRRLYAFISAALLVCCASLTGAFAQETEIKGLITQRSSDTVTVRSDAGTQIVTLTDSTKVQTPKGLGLRKQQMSWAELIPGLKVKIKAVPGADGRPEAKTITFSKDDLQTASMIQAGLAPTEEKVAANQVQTAANKEAISTNEANIAANKSQIAANQEDVSRRFSDLADYDVKDQAVV